MIFFFMFCSRKYNTLAITFTQYSNDYIVDHQLRPMSTFETQELNMTERLKESKPFFREKKSGEEKCLLPTIMCT